MTQNELRRLLVKYKPKTQYTQKTDAIKNNRQVVVNPVKYKPKADETVINLPGQKPHIVRRRNEVVSTDNRSNAQRRLDWKKDKQTRQYYQQQKNSQAFEEGVNAMTKLISPSTYAGAAARSLTGDGTFGSNFTSGTGFNDPIANISFDVATPIVLKSLQNPIPKLFNSYETLNNTGREALNSVLRWQAKHPIFNRTILPPNQAGHFYRVGSSPMIDDAVNTGLIQSRTGWYHGSLDKAINDHPQLLKYFTRDELDNMRPSDLRDALEDLGLDWNSFGKSKNTSRLSGDILYRNSTNHGGTVGFVKDGYFYNPTNSDYIIDGTNASRFAKGHHGSYNNEAPIHKGTPVVLMENGSPKYAKAPASEFNYWEKNGPFWHRRDFNTQRAGYVQPGITIEQARDYDQLLKFVDSRTKDLQ